MPKKGYKQSEAQKAATAERMKAYQAKKKIERAEAKAKEKVEGIKVKSSVLKEINLEGEFNTMATKLNKKKDEKSGKDYEYECGECGGGFNHKAEGGKCPLCGVELE